MNAQLVNPQVANLPETQGAPYAPGLPRSTRAAKGAEPLRRRTRSSPPVPWDAQAVAAYWDVRRRKDWSGPPEADKDRPVDGRKPGVVGVTALLRMMAVGDIRLFPGNGDTAHGRVIQGCMSGPRYRDGLRFSTRSTPGEGVWVTRLE